MSGAQLPSLPCALDGSYARLNFCLPRDVPTLPRNDIASPAISLSPGGRALFRCDVPPRSHLGRRVRAGLFIPGSAMRAVLQNFDTSPELGGNERRVRADGLHGFNHEASNGQEVVNLCQGVGNA